jgi:multiple RNA-binding domain-containing protein 1
MNIDKAAILNPESGENAAVKLALAETHIIQETKSYLEAQGVLLSSFSTRGRSDTTILVKNIPYGTTADQIRDMFEPHGDLNRVLVPPAGTMAVVEFDKPDEAAKAFRAVAYRRLGNSVVYLEKGPLGMFVEGPVPGSSSTASASTPNSTPYAVTVADQELGNAAGDVGEEPSITGGSTLYVKNLSFSTTQERLTQMFRHLPSFLFARVQTKPDPKRPEGPRLSMGYGFVGFKDVESAKKALKSMQGFVLDGHALHVKFAGRGAEEESKGKDSMKSKSRTTKMIVKNVPFEATKKDIRELFGYGFLVLTIFFLVDVDATAHTAISNRYAYPKNSILAHADSHSSSLYRVSKQKTHTLHCDIPTCLGDIWSSSGRKKQNRTWMCFARKLVSDMAKANLCPGGSGRLTLARLARRM